MAAADIRDSAGKQQPMIAVGQHFKHDSTMMSFKFTPRDTPQNDLILLQPHKNLKMLDLHLPSIVTKHVLDFYSIPYTSVNLYPQRSADRPSLP